MSTRLQPIQAIRGMKDIPPDQTSLWQYLEHKLRQLTSAYGYQEIRFPLVEKTELFQRSIGDITDIVEKEMYTFIDRNNDSLTLRPEGTAGCVRAGIENGLLYNQVQRLWYLGAMFRHERPQKGRQRQFQQFGIEAFGMPGPDIDAELILLTARLWRELGIEPQLTLQLNSLGSAATRLHYQTQLTAYFKQHFDQLDEDSQRRLHTNPLRILDSKNPKLQTLIANAPQLLDYLDTESAEHFATLCKLLDTTGIRYTINPRLVRGLDYYNRTVFEWVMATEGAQNTVCAGGRYDTLVEQLGGSPTPAVGFALGLERTINLLSEIVKPKVGQAPLAYLIIASADANQPYGLILAEQLRNAIPLLTLVTDCIGGSFKNQFKRADKSGAQLALILGEEEIKLNKITVKYLRDEKPQQTLAKNELINLLQILTERKSA